MGETRIYVTTPQGTLPLEEYGSFKEAFRRKEESKSITIWYTEPLLNEEPVKPSNE